MSSTWRVRRVDLYDTGEYPSWAIETYMWPSLQSPRHNSRNIEAVAIFWDVMSAMCVSFVVNRYFVKRRRESATDSVDCFAAASACYDVDVLDVDADAGGCRTFV